MAAKPAAVSAINELSDNAALLPTQLYLTPPSCSRWSSRTPPVHLTVALALPAAAVTGMLSAGPSMAAQTGELADADRDAATFGEFGDLLAKLVDLPRRGYRT